VVRFRLSGLVLSCVLAQLLAAPALGIVLQDEAELAAFHNHALAAWPALERLRTEPVSYFQGARTWLSERIFPIQLVTRVQKSVLVHWLHEAPEPRIALGEDGHIFLNGASNDTLFGLYGAACVHAQSASTARSLEQALRYWATLAQLRGYTSDFVVIPTAATLYADMLPESTPAHLRRACLDTMAGRTALMSVHAPKHTSSHFLYPLGEMLAAKRDEAFYPKGNWHPVGLSLKVVRDTYLAQLGLQPDVRENMRHGLGPAEILVGYGIDWARPRYFLENPAVSVVAERDSLVRRAIAPLFRGDRFVTHFYENSRPVLDQTALLLTDSFGDLAAEVFAGAFRKLVQVNLNDLQAGSQSQVIDLVQRVERVDRVIFLIQEGNAHGLSRWR
jgi:hypothetical protein